MKDEIIQKVRNCPNLPTMPSIAMQVLDLAQRPEAAIAEIARIISKDPALSSKILRTVNSSFYGRSQNVSTISHALVILGIQSVKTLVLGFSLVTNLTRSKGNGFKHIAYWKRSIFAATAARSIAAKAGLVQQEEAFLAALLKDIGMLVLDLVIGEQYGELCAQARTHQDLLALEREKLGLTHAEVGGILAQQWKLPPLLSVPLSCHHTPELVSDPALRKLTTVVGLGGRCADVFVDDEPAKPIAEARRLIAGHLGTTEAECDALLDEIGKRTREVASLFEINIGSVSEYEAILKKANEALVEITLQSQMQATQLQQQNEQLKEQVSRDGLTGLANRAALDAFLASQFELAVKSGKPLSVLMMDLDNFKKINDTYGHQAGDQVLRTIGKLLRAVARPTDLAARYGGEEMMLLLPQSPRAFAATLGENLRRAIAAKPIQCEKQPVVVTASIGVACFEPGSPLPTAAHLLKAADLAVYSAKHSGKNCVKVFAPKAAA